jgi:DNA polymerase-3 subunit gamma/tau
MKKSTDSKSESKQVLYRKYRPETWEDVIGQDHIVKVLQGAIKLGNISHAYLFAGSRGTGKTSVARIIARELEVNPVDLYEIDAASNRGIDDVRDIRDSVGTHPFESKYKLYIVDEVHMLTKEAFNALLKTLEEPPEYVVFVLATTEIEKIPDTVLSRCQVFQFRKPNQKILKDIVLSISKKEGFTIEPSSADLIATLADGSFRDAQGILEKVLSFTKDTKISREEVESVTGAPRSVMVNDFVTALSDKDLPKSLQVIRKLSESNVDPKIFLKLALLKVRLIMLMKYAPEDARDFSNEVSEDDLVFLKQLSVKEGSGINSQLLVELLTSYESIGRAYIKELPLELALVKLFGPTAS